MYEDRDDNINASAFDGTIRIDVWKRGHDTSKLLQYIQDSGIDVVINHFHIARLSYPIQKTIKKHQKIKWINTVHLDPESYSRIKRFNRSNISNRKAERIIYFFYNRYIKWLRKKSYNNSEATILLSKSFIQSYEQYIGEKNCAKLYYINNPVRGFPAANTIADKENLIINLGRLQILQKRTDRVLKFWQLFREEKTFCKWNLAIVGDGPDSAVLQAMAEQMCVPNDVFTGHTKHPNEYYQRAKIILMTSDYEGWPLVLLEAMSYGCVPIVMDNFSSLRDIVDDGVNGIIIDNDDYDAMIKAVKIINNNYKMFSEQAIYKSQRFKASRIVGQWISVLNMI